ncbi:tRNA nuclease WapA [Frondihabitans sp. 762G35]|uniref:RHS repeat-associated core domain-containing protein n=1 Tax=Frondihabitans sp. 762G35 TaxID=1446794 RepID=UPI000D202716|nr:RHS repeat-associated core domain-containing protein [Frondihabitans sp. 762G35]ARC58397.1 tRNA nuclease WapA [Frondihabitans sp. 762G35]
MRALALGLGLALLAAFLIAVPAPAHAAGAATGTGGLYVPATQRIAQSTNGSGGLPNSRLTSNHWYQIPIEGAGSLPTDGISAVQITFTISGQTSAGFIHADQGSATSPNTSTPYMTYDSSNSIANAAVLPVGANGNIQVQVTSAADLVINVQGYYTDGDPAAGGFVATSATSVFNSGNTSYTTGQSTTFQVGGTSQVPSDASAVVLSVIESNQGTDPGYLYAYPAGGVRSTGLNWPAGKNIEWTTVVTLPANGQITLSMGSSSGVRLSAAVQGYFVKNNGPAVAGAFTPGTARVYNSQSPSQPIAAGATRTIQVAGTNGVPAAGTGITDAAVNLSVISGTSAQGHAPLFASDSTAGTDAIQYYASTTTTAFSTVKLGSDGAVKITNVSNGTINVILDVEGWYSLLDNGPTKTNQTGSRPSQTALTFGVSDQVTAKVDVGTGNLMVSTGGLTLPAIGSKTSIGQTYNSLGWQTGYPYDLSANNWTMGLASLGSLSQNGAGIVYTAADGSTWQFTPALVNGVMTYQSPQGLQATLTADAGSYSMNFWSSNSTITFSRNGEGGSIVDRNKNKVSVTYANDQPTAVVSSAGSAGAKTATVAYDQGSLTTTVSQTSGSSNRQVTWSKDSANNLTTFVDAAGATTTFAYTGHDLTSITGPTGAVTSFTYDGATHRVAQVDQQNTTAGSPGTSTTRLSYTSDTQTLVAGPNTDTAATVGSVPHTTYTIDSNDLVTKTVDPVGRTRSKTYTNSVNGFAPTTSTEGSGSGSTTSTNTYGANAGQSLSKAQTPGGSSSSATYGSAAANTQYSVTGSTDDAGNKSTLGYDGLGNSSSNAAPDGSTASIVRNTPKVGGGTPNGDGSNDGQVYSATAPMQAGTQNKTSYHYDANRQLDTITPVTVTTANGSAGLGANHFTYDPFGRVASQSDGNGVTTSYTYDNDDRLLTTSFSDGTGTVTDTYDVAGRKLTEASATGTVTNTYDQLGRLLTTRNSAGGDTETYTYDKASNQVSSSDSFGTYTNTYDDSNVLEVTKYPKAGSYSYVNYATDSHGRRIDEWLGGTATYTDTNVDTTGTNPDPATVPATWSVRYQTIYDQSTGRVKEIKSWTSADPTHPTFDTIYCHADSTVTGNTDPTNCSTNPLYDREKIQSAFDVLGQQTTVYSYDTSGRIVRVKQTGGNAGNTDWQYSYDKNGNRTATTTNGTQNQTLTYNEANQLTVAGFTYDANGNLLAGKTADGTGTATYTYNGANQMTSATINGTKTTYTYAGSAQNALLSSSTAGGTTVNYSYGANGLATYQNGSATSHLYADPTTGQAVMLTTSTGTAALYINDGLGNIAGLTTDGSGPAFRESYDPYGAGTLTPGTGNGYTQNPYLFKNGLADRATGLVKFGARWYNAFTGTWTQRDTLDAPLDPQNANRYQFAGGDPINGSDPTGAISGRAALGLGNTLFGLGQAISSGNSQTIAKFAVSTVVGTLTGIACEGIAGAATGGVGAIGAAEACNVLGGAVGNATVGENPFDPPLI